MYYVGFEVLSAVVMKSITFWDITLCSPFSANRRFGGTYRSACNLFSRWFLARLIFDLEDGGDMLLRNVG
jgi:hypothetical protein